MIWRRTDFAVANQTLECSKMFLDEYNVKRLGVRAPKARPGAGFTWHLTMFSCPQSPINLQA